MRQDMRESKDAKVLILGLIIGFVQASALISLDFWRWAWDVIAWGLNHDWRGERENIECDLAGVALHCCCLGLYHTIHERANQQESNVMKRSWSLDLVTLGAWASPGVGVARHEVQYIHTYGVHTYGTASHLGGRHLPPSPLPSAIRPFPFLPPETRFWCYFGHDFDT